MDADKVKKLVEIDTPTVSNGMGLLGVREDAYGYTGPDIRALMPDMGVRVGVAVTARLDTTSPGTEEGVGQRHLYFEWLQTMVETAKLDGSGTMPVFAVMEGVGLRPRQTVVIGDGMGTNMLRAGAVGFITNAAIRDIQGLREVPMPCWGAGTSPMHGQMRWLDVGSTVVIDGMTIRNGDVIHADENGAVVLPAGVADQVYDRAIEVREREAEFFKQVRDPDLDFKAWLSDQIAQQGQAL